jgi:alpha-L-fucosidase
MDRRQFLIASAASSLIGPRALHAAATSAAPRPRPTRAQLDWQRDEFALFVHFGVNTVTDREWGDGTENPRIFDPAALDARQWTRTARAAGVKSMILTAKHHDGFCLWPTRTTTHSVASSPWRGGTGDLVREFVDACRADGIRPGLYLSPWDRHEPTYGDSPRYNDLYIAQLTELLTQYGEIHEVWFDGANAEGPNGRKQVYDWPRTWGTVRRLQPRAVMFSDAGPDVRWIGNESGTAGTTNWSMVDPRIVTAPGVSGDEVMRSLQQGDRDGTVWRPGETDVSIRPGWFYHPAEDTKVRSADNLVDLFFTSVGRNSKLLLNVPPTRDGLFHASDVAALQGMRTRLDAMFARNLAASTRTTFRVTTPTSAESTLRFTAPVTIALLDLAESIASGQRVARYRVETDDGRGWQPLTQGTTIGHRRLEKVSAAGVRRLRVLLDETVERPLPITIRVYPPV